MTEKTKAGKLDQKKKVVAGMKALSNESRLTIFELIRSGRARGRLDADNRPTVCEVAGNFDMALSTISHHMKELRSAGLITCERDGQTIH
jgi:ArsR family transcriptional regulator